MRTVSAREANQQFSAILDAAVGGEEITITRRGKPVAKLMPIQESRSDAERERELREFIDWIREGVDLGAPVRWTRDEIYDEACGIAP